MKLTKKFIKENPEMKLKELLKPALEVGKWYKFEDALFNYQKENKVYGFLFGKWIGKDWTWNRKDVLPATPEEIKNALEKEAVKRRLMNAKIFIDAYSGLKNNKNNYTPCIEDYCIWTKFGCVFNNGTLATIINPKQITKQEIEKELGYEIEIV